ncbi:hypothetical protein BH09PLA1_BH09PLA1_31340 [soil metagenome]
MDRIYRGTTAETVTATQRAADRYTKTHGQVPLVLTDVTMVALIGGQRVTLIPPKSTGAGAKSNQAFRISGLTSRPDPELPDARDHWQRSLILSNQNGRVVIMSYGRDGVPGGSGWDADIRSDAAPPDELVSWGEFFPIAPRIDFIIACACALISACAIMFLHETPIVRTRMKYRSTLFLLAITAAIAMTLAGAFFAFIASPMKP